MKITNDRNPYLKRLSSSTPHKYSYDIEKGKYFIHSETGTQKQITKIGTYKPKFKHYFSGFANNKDRYKQGIQNDPAFLHYVPDFKYHKNQSYYTPMLDKMAGYAQYPYKLKSQQFPEHLNKADEKININNSIKMKLEAKLRLKKSQSETKNQIKVKLNHSVTKKDQTIFEHSTSFFMNPQQKDKYFNLSFMSMTESKPLPKRPKRTCYNYKCKHLKQFVFDEKSKIQAQSTKYSSNMSNFQITMGKSFHQTSLRLEGQENKYIQQFN